jgi:hypothetical protein
MLEQDGGPGVIPGPPTYGKVNRREPIPVGPFLEFCYRREQEIRRELDNYPAISGGHQFDPVARLVMSFGWDPGTGVRKLDRWKSPDGRDSHSGWVDRAVIEDALRSAGVDIEDIYPDLPEPSPRVIRMGQSRRMTDAQVIAAHTVYTKGRMTMYALGDLIWKRYGYATPSACTRALSVAFKGLGLPIRQCAAMTRSGARCRHPPLTATDFCQEHGALSVRPSDIGAASATRRRYERMWTPSVELVALARAMHVEQAMTWRAIGRELVSMTPLTSPTYVSYRLSTIAAQQGWDRTERKRAA